MPRSISYRERHALLREIREWVVMMGFLTQASADAARDDQIVARRTLDIDTGGQQQSSGAKTATSTSSSDPPSSSASTNQEKNTVWVLEDIHRAGVKTRVAAPLPRGASTTACLRSSLHSTCCASGA